MSKASEVVARESRPASCGSSGAFRQAAHPLRVVVADDHPVIRAGLRYILERGGMIQVVGEAGDGRAAIEEIGAQRPDVAVMDLSMPELNGIDATRQIRKRYPDTQVLILSVHASENSIMDAVVAGAAGFLLKEAAGPELERAVELVAQKKGYFSPEITSVIVRRIKERGTGRAILSAREREVVHLIAEPHLHEEIASKLFISARTVKSHRGNVMRKLGIRTTVDLIRYAIDQGLVNQYQGPSTLVPVENTPYGVRESTD